MREHTQTHVTDFASNSVDLELIYTRVDINTYGTQVPVLVEVTLSCHSGEGALDCRVQPQRANYNGAACGIVGDEVQASLAGQ